MYSRVIHCLLETGPKRMIRKQLYITPEQQRKLRRLASRRVCTEGIPGNGAGRHRTCKVFEWDKE